ncbi:MAG: S8 family serine peptidase [Dehalococcoidia bacterium]|nr:S8 family serine peptidase [Dehalococcoidia bacterium]
MAVIGVALLAVAAWGQGALAQPAPATPEAPAETVIVQYDTGATVRAQGAGEPSLRDQGFRVLSVPAGMTRDAFIEQLRADPDVLSVEPNARVQAAAVPDDPLFQGNQLPYYNLIGARDGWDVATGRGDAVVAVLDTGTDLGHEDLASRLWENTRDADNDGIDDDGNGCIDDRYGCRFASVTTENKAGCGYTDSTPRGDVTDDHGKPGASQQSHGTLVAGIIGAAGNNNTGIAGAAWNVRIMTVKVLDCGPFGGEPQGWISDVAAGIDYARRMGADVISLSLSANVAAQNADTHQLRTAIAAAEAEGVIIVAAAGNHSTTSTQPGPGYPAAYTQFANVIAVGASDINGNWATYSNYGPALDLAAPGVGIVGTVRTNNGFTPAYGTAPVGTSFATPLVSALFALVKTRNSALTMQEYVDIVKDAATPPAAATHGGNWAGAGIVHYGRALASVPMTLSGDVLHNWQDVPAGTEVRALVNGVECGRTTAFQFGGVPRSLYELRVQATGQQTGCGAPGRSVVLTVAGQEAEPHIPWGAINADLAQRKDVTSVSPPPGQIVVQQLGGGWNNVANLDATGPLPGALTSLPLGWQTVLKWDPLKEFLRPGSGGYRHFYSGTPDYVNDLPSIARYDAYWVLGGGTNIASLNPEPSSGRAIGLQPGWNNITWTGKATEVSAALAQVAGQYTQVLQYDNATGTWRSYIPGQPRHLQAFNGLFQFNTYWIYMNSGAVLTMP